MPAQSKAQQRFMGMVHATQKGDMKNPSPEVEKAADSMSDKDAKDFASTSHKRLPNRVKTEILKRLKTEYGLMIPGHHTKPAALSQSLDDLEGVDESTNPVDIIKDLDKVRNDLIKQVDVLIAKKKKLYSNVDIESPMSADEKKLDKDIQTIFSKIQQLIQQKRKIKTESINSDEINSSVIPAALKVRFEKALELLQGKELSYNQKIKLLAMIIDSLGIDKSELAKISSKLKTNLD